MGLTLSQLKTYTTGVLKGWFTNKDTLDKLSESEDGKTLLFAGKKIEGTATGGAGISNIVGRKTELIYQEDNGNIVVGEAGKDDFHVIKDVFNYDSLIVEVWIKDNNEDFDLISKEIPISLIQTMMESEKAYVELIKNHIWLKNYEPETYRFTFVSNAGTGYKNVNIYGVKYQEAVVGKKLYHLLDDTVIAASPYVTGSAPYEMRAVAELPSIADYDEVIIRYSVDWDFATQKYQQPRHYTMTQIIPTAAITYGLPCTNFTDTDKESASIGFINATHIGILWINHANVGNVSHIEVWGAKYEATIKEVTNTQVTEAIADTVTELNTKDAQ